jgi:molybdate transport system substrate-binding protein
MTDTASAQAAPALAVASARSLQEVLRPLGEAFGRTQGAAVNFFFGPVGTVREHLEAGAPADVVILSDTLIEELSRAGRLVAASRRPIGRVGIMLAVRAEDPAPDISTAERFRAALLAAGRIACSDPAIGGSAGTHFAALIRRFGIEEALRPKLLLHQSGVETARTVARGEADFGITLLPEMLPVAGVRPAAPLPAELQKFTTYVAAIASASCAAALAAAFIAAAADPAQADAWRRAGVEPL